MFKVPIPYKTMFGRKLVSTSRGYAREKGRDLTQSPTPTEKSRKLRDNIKNATKNFNYTTIADRQQLPNWCG